MNPITLIQHLTYSLMSAVCCGNQNRHQREVYEQMQNPKPGDLVAEVSTWGRSIDGFGRLVRTEQEKFTHADGEETTGGTVYVIRVIRCVSGELVEDEKETRWSNASFYALPSKVAKLFAPTKSQSDAPAQGL